MQNLSLSTAVAFPARGVAIGQLPPYMQRFHVGTCEFTSDPARLAGFGIEPPSGGSAVAAVLVDGGEAQAARQVLLEAYGFLALSCRCVPAMAQEWFSAWGERLGVPAGSTAERSPIDLVAIEPALRQAEFFRIEDELFRVHAATEMGQRLKAAMGWLGSALFAFDSSAEVLALAKAVEVVLRPAGQGEASLLVDFALRAATGWDGWYRVRKHVEGPGLLSDASLLPGLREAVGRLLERSLAAADYTGDHGQMLARLGISPAA